MLNFFNPIKGLLKLEDVQTDNNVFRLHYKVTAIILCVLSLIVTSRQYIGNPIECIVRGVMPDVMNSYCWIYSTFTLPNRAGARIGKDAVHPGVAPFVDGEDEVHYHKYYQWVCFVLFFQAVAFYFPRFMWKTWEGGRIKSLVLELDSQIIEEDVKNFHKKQLVNYFTSNMHGHNFYAMRFFFCEFINFLNVIIQMYLTNYFLGSEFSTYGYDVFKFSDMKPELRDDPMSRVFPKVSKCTFQKYGPSGSIVKIDGLCLLTLNIVNEKIYVFLWFWFAFVAIISSLNLVYRIAVVSMPNLRLYLLSAKSRLTSRTELEKIIKECKIGDWFVLYQLGKNINSLIFKELLSELANKLDSKNTV